MGLFDRRRTVPVFRHVPGADKDDDSLDPQGMALELNDAFADRDAKWLRALTPAQRAEQEQARRRVYEGIDTLWEDAKDRGLDPAIRPEDGPPSHPRAA